MKIRLVAIYVMTCWASDAGAGVIYQKAQISIEQPKIGDD